MKPFSDFDTSPSSGKRFLQRGIGPGSGRSEAFIHAAIIVSMIGVLIADMYTSLGIAVWVLYLVPVTFSLGLWRPRVPLMAALVSTLLIAYTFMTDEPGVDRNVAAMNRGFGLFTIWVMAIVGYFFVSNKLAVQRQQWLQAGRTGLSEVMSGELSPEQFGDKVLRFLAEFLDARAGALFIGDADRFRRIATYGVPAAADIPETFSAGDGLLGQAVKDRRGFLVQDVPDGYLRVGSSLGDARLRSLAIAPMKVDAKVNAVLELGFLQPAGEHVMELLEHVSEALSVVVRSGSYRLHLQNLLEETRKQAEELQLQSEELRAANEELEEQSTALQASQLYLEQQQAILEESNAQLEEQTQLLETQRDDLAGAHAAIEMKALELARASQYKSDFLANMSHELRTPLNSTLILARLLADNRDENLTDEQVTSAETIVSAGNDLLTLINDILDLSKIEAGRMDIHSEPVWLKRFVKDLGTSLRPLAEQKGLLFDIQLASDCPDAIETDRQRLEQVLKNLLSNAIKFTEKGQVLLRASAAPDGGIAFAVVDTGIGIPEAQQQAIFEAFNQIDSAANRKYNGTGLGLSISRELTRLLGGEIRLTSVVGKGSTFTVVLPLKWEQPLISPDSERLYEERLHENHLHEERQAAEAYRDIRKAPGSRAWDKAAAARRRIRDDREELTGNSRVILVVEDDESFARILCDLAHELDFQCLIAATAEEAMVIAAQYLPSAVVLDIGLPDHSGLTVLDRLKYDSRTRHIPVHVISASDYIETALALGAVSYMLKPVTREELVDTLKSLESRLVQRMRRVLVVEDDAVQLHSLRRLLASQDVETIGVSSAAECLEQLKSTTFDCMVLDLSLPDASGNSLLETLSQEDAYSFPPVIVYTGRDVSLDEEHDLRRYSKSIIIKGAKSPERLLDEVTLFLHQVVAELPPEQQRMIQKARSREAALENRRILIVEDDVRNVFALSSILEPRGAIVQIARNGREALDALELSRQDARQKIDLVLMDVMMPEMDGLAATREIRKRPEWKALPIIMLTAKAMQEDQEACFAAGANDYMAKPLDVDKLLSLVRVWMRR